MKSNCGPNVFFGTFVRFGRRSESSMIILGKPNALRKRKILREFLESHSLKKLQIGIFSFVLFLKKIRKNRGKLQ